MVLSKDTVDMMVNEYEFSSDYNQEQALYDNVRALAESHEKLRAALDEYANPEWFVECFDPPIDKMPLHIMRRYFSKAKEALKTEDTCGANLKPGGTPSESVE